MRARTSRSGGMRVECAFGSCKGQKPWGGDAAGQQQHRNEMEEELWY